MEPIRVLVADGHPIFRYGLCRLLSEDDGIHVIGEADSAPDLLAQADCLRPDVVVLDVQLPGSDGIQVARELRCRCSDPPRILVLSAYEDEERLFDALRAGVHGYLPKNASHQALAEAIRRVHGGRKLLTPEQATEVVERFQVLARGRVRERAGLSDTELRVLERLARGETYEEMGDRLYLSERTIKRKVQSAVAKMGADNRVQAVAEAIRRGLI